MTIAKTRMNIATTDIGAWGAVVLAAIACVIAIGKPAIEAIKDWFGILSRREKLQAEREAHQQRKIDVLEESIQNLMQQREADRQQREDDHRKLQALSDDLAKAEQRAETLEIMVGTLQEEVTKQTESVRSLKGEVNHLLGRLGEPPRYFVESGDEKGQPGQPKPRT
jgi:predicted RNase H-like nuclease (RuvC/YqgF family)